MLQDEEDTADWISALNGAISSLAVVGSPFNVKHKAHISYHEDQNAIAVPLFPLPGLF